MAATFSLERVRHYILPAVAALVGLGVALGIATVPSDVLNAAVDRAGFASVLPAAASPIGTTGRTLLALVAGALIAVCGFAPQAKAWLVAQVDAFARKGATGGTDPADAPTVRRADAHPDAPPRRPIRAASDLGDPLPIFGEEDHRSAPLPPPSEQPLPADLDRPLSDFDPAAVPLRPMAPAEPVAPLTRRAEPEVPADDAAPRLARLASGEDGASVAVGGDSPPSPASAPGGESPTAPVVATAATGHMSPPAGDDAAAAGPPEGSVQARSPSYAGEAPPTPHGFAAIMAELPAIVQTSASSPDPVAMSAAPPAPVPAPPSAIGSKRSPIASSADTERASPAARTSPAPARVQSADVEPARPVFPADRLMPTALAPDPGAVPTREAEKAAPAPSAPGDDSIAGLLARLERGAAQRRVVAAPSEAAAPPTPPAAPSQTEPVSLDETLQRLRRLAAG